MAIRIFPKSCGLLGILLGLVFLALAGVSLSNSMPRVVPGLLTELLTNFAAYLVPLYLLFVPILYLLRHRVGRRFAWLLIFNSLALCAYSVFPILPFLLKAAPQHQSAAQASIGALSVDLENSVEYAAEFIDIARKNRPTLIGVSGVSAAVAERLKELSSDWRIVAMEPRADGFGLALLSNLELEGAVTTTVSESFEELPPVIQANFKWNNEVLRAAVLRLPPAFSKQNETIAELIIRRLFVPLRHLRAPFVVLGNLNATPSSGYYGRLWWATGAHNAMEGFGYPSSCCQGLPGLWLPVNHILFRGVVNTDFAVLPHKNGMVAPVLSRLAPIHSSSELSH